jgi:hypothetical protein
VCRIPFTVRSNGRYAFRRRIHFRNVISKPLTMALQTADPGVARTRAAMLAARFAIVKAELGKVVSYERTLTGEEIEAIFRHKLQKELGMWMTSAYEDEAWSSSVPDVALEYKEAYRFLSSPDSRYGMVDELRGIQWCPAHGVSAERVEEYAASIRNTFSDEDVSKILSTLGAPKDESNIAAARKHMLRAGAVAGVRAQRLFDDDVMAAPDPFRELTSDLPAVSDAVGRLMALLNGMPQVASPAPEPPTPATSQFAIYDARRFSEVIDEVIAGLKADKVWKGDLKQQRQIMLRFAWITGDLPLGDYDHRHVAMFKNALHKIPAKFRYGTAEVGPMSRSFEVAIASVQPVKPATRRNLKTINRDLSTMSTVAKRLAETAWKPRIPNTVVLDFASATVAIKEEDSTELRPPWTRSHMEILFASPLYTGGGGAKRRLRADCKMREIYHDAAYFAPLLWYYTQACREEICGLEVADVVTDHAVAHIAIRDNFTRGRDGEKAGEKRLARRRKLPIHSELTRLGFLDYVAAIRAEGHLSLFPELYILDSKRGGAQFYDRAWLHLVHWIEDRLELPRNEAGKGPDIHSIRSLGSSFYERDGVNEIIRAQIMGHAAKGTNAKHYSKRIQTEGLAVVLAERLEFIERYVPTITADIDRAPINLLPLEQRSRVGTGRARKVRSDSGRIRTG